MFESLCTLTFLALGTWVVLNLGAEHPKKVDKLNASIKRSASTSIRTVSDGVERIKRNSDSKDNP